MRILNRGLSFLSSTLDVQSAMEESQKLEEKGEDLDVEELKEQEMDMMGKVKTTFSSLDFSISFS